MPEYYKEREKYFVKCPFCGKQLEQYAPANAICPCGSKFYYFNNKWSQRYTGVWKDNE